MKEKPSYYEDIRSLGEDLKNIGDNVDNAIENSMSSYIFNSKSLNPMMMFISDYLKLMHSEIKRFKLLYNYTEKPNTKRVND